MIKTFTTKSRYHGSKKLNDSNKWVKKMKYGDKIKLSDGQVYTLKYPMFQCNDFSLVDEKGEFAGEYTRNGLAKFLEGDDGVYTGCVYHVPGSYEEYIDGSQEESLVIEFEYLAYQTIEKINEFNKILDKIEQTDKDFSRSKICNKAQNEIEQLYTRLLLLIIDY